MAASLVATVGASDANAYATIAEAEAYAANRKDASDWTGASSDEKAQALIMATWRIDQEEFEGTPVHPLNGTSSGTTQALRFPRYGCISDEGWAYLETVIPEPVKKATYELALEILGGGISLTDTGLEGFEDVKLGPLSVTPRLSRAAGKLPENVMRHLRPLLVESSSLAFRMLRS